MVSPVRFWLSALLAYREACLAGIVQLVEHLLAKEKVTGSNPVARSFLQMADGRWLDYIKPFAISWFTGDVAKW